MLSDRSEWRSKKRVLIVTIITNIIDAALTINSIETVVKAVKYSQQ